MESKTWYNNDGRISVPHLEWHASHACNFTCESCNHFSNHAHNEIIPKNEIKKWLESWGDRIAPREIAVLGGEPLMNKEILDIIALGRECFGYDGIKDYEIVTNGWLLEKFPDLPKVLKENDCWLAVSIHGDSLEYNKKFQTKVVDIVNEWVNEYDIKVRPYHSSVDWVRAYFGFGNNMEPFEDNDPEKSWDNCPTGQECFQLLDSNIFKCAPLAYLPMQKKRYPNMSEKWDHYLEYNPLTPNCSEDDIIEFFNRKAESFCAMCPSNPTLFKKRNPELPIKFYEAKKKGK